MSDLQLYYHNLFTTDEQGNKITLLYWTNTRDRLPNERAIRESRCFVVLPNHQHEKQLRREATALHKKIVEGFEKWLAIEELKKRDDNNAMRNRFDFLPEERNAKKDTKKEN